MERGGGGCWWGGVDTPMHTMNREGILPKEAKFYLKFLFYQYNVDQRLYEVLRVSITLLEYQHESILSNKLEGIGRPLCSENYNIIYH